MLEREGRGGILEPAASVIVSTYDRPENLARCLEGLRHQTTRAFEIIVADDGSGPATRAVIERAERTLRVLLRHVWQEDRGFRKAAVLNAASRAARGAYLIYTDGDCVAHRRFVENHLRHRAPGRMLVGRAAKLSEARSRRIDSRAIARGAHVRTGPRDWWDERQGRARNMSYAFYLPGEAGFRLVQRLKKSRSLRGGNCSLWKHDLERVNGWNEDFESWGLEDVELGWRLRHAGVEPMLVVNRAICIHLWHPATRREGASARAAYNATRARGLAWCPNGLVRSEKPLSPAHR
ncbi:MAG: glycosyltransferase [Deltaproteobacteria bacterium]|nr:glycosyltransferase [Deltaproteobacteria bacterium]